MPTDAAIRQLIHASAAKIWPAIAPEMIEAQVLVESAGDPRAESPAGARGLLQLMPGTAAELGLSPEQCWDPARNLAGGIRYLRRQFEAFGELPNYYDRVSAALASYNGGRGYVNKALALAREACGAADGTVPGPWQRWDVASAFLADPRCLVSGRRPDAAQMLTYVARVRAMFHRLTKGGKP